MLNMLIPIIQCVLGLATRILLAASVQAYVLLAEAMPYDASSLDNGPLSADGSDYPCKQRPGVYSAKGTTNILPRGSTRWLSFKGTAVHGGGSCQVSITYDKLPTKDSVFKVIHSVIGGCPSAFTFTVPADLPTGEATLAWTWLNMVGDGKRYMNCAPVTITDSPPADAAAVRAGTASSSSFRSSTRASAAFDALPEIFRANIGNGCSKAHSDDVGFPNPGESGDRLGSRPPVAPKGSCGTVMTATEGNDSSRRAAGGSASSPSASPSPSPASSSPAARLGIMSHSGNASSVAVSASAPHRRTWSTSSTSTAAANPDGTVSSFSTFTTQMVLAVKSAVKESQLTMALAGSRIAMGSRNPSATAPTAASALSAAPPTQAPSELTGPCAPDDVLICYPDSESFQICASGAGFAAWPMAPGTVCSPVAQAAVASPLPAAAVRRAVPLSPVQSQTSRLAAAQAKVRRSRARTALIVSLSVAILYALLALLYMAL